MADITIKISNASRDALRFIAASTGEKHYEVLDRLLLTEAGRVEKQRKRFAIGTQSAKGIAALPKSGSADKVIATLRRLKTMAERKRKRGQK